MSLPEPKKYNSIRLLAPYLQGRAQAVLADMRTAGYDPVVVETWRSPERQRWLYGKGRTGWQLLARGISPAYAQPLLFRVTDTTGSMHSRTDRQGQPAAKALDICSRSRGYDRPAFFRALNRIYRKHGFSTLERQGDWAHGEWRAK